MYDEWPFFRALLSNTQMALFKANMGIAQEYATLVQDRQMAGEIFALIEEEYHRTVTEILGVARASVLIEENETLALSLRRRNPYLDPLNHIQITLLRRFRAEPRREEESESRWLDPLLRTINAIAAGMRNTG